MMMMMMMGSDINSGCDLRKTMIYITGFYVFLQTVTKEKARAQEDPPTGQKRVLLRTGLEEATHAHTRTRTHTHRRGTGSIWIKEQ